MIAPQPQNKDLLLANSKKYAEFSIMAYQMYAGCLEDPYDPFKLNIKKLGDTKIQDSLKEQAADAGKTVKWNSNYVEYNTSKLDIRKPVYYRDNTVYYFEPPKKITERVGRVFMVKGDEPIISSIKEYDDKKDEKDNSIDIYVFEGRTGIGETKKENGVSSPMGYVAYDRKTKEITVTFRGSRSGNAIKGALGGLDPDDTRSTNADWKTDMDAEPKNFSEICKDGKIARGFAKTYESCRPNIINIIAQIQQSDPDPNFHPKLVTTGHSLGGALATIMYVDAKKGKLQQRVLEKMEENISGSINKKKFADNLFENPQCYAFSVPLVMDRMASDTIGNQPNYHRIFFQNDLVIFGGNISETIKGEGLFENKGLLYSIKSKTDVNLGNSKGKINDFHELTWVYEEIQKRLGIKPNDIERYSYIIDKDLHIVHHSGKKIPPESISQEQAAVIANQFSFNYLIDQSIEMVKREAGSPEENTQLINYLNDLNKQFSGIKPYENKEKFNEFIKNLNEAVKKLSSDSFDREKSKADPQKIYNVVEKLLAVFLALLNIANEFIKGFARWLKIEPTIQLQDKKLLEMAIEELDKCNKDMKNLLLNIKKENPLNEIFNKMTDLVNKDLVNKIDKFKEDVVKLNERQHSTVLTFATAFAKGLEKSIALCAEFANDMLPPKELSEKDCEEKRKKLLDYADSLFTELTAVESQVIPESKELEVRLQKEPVDDVGKIMKDLILKPFKTFAGLTFGLKVGIAKFVESLINLGRAIVNLFKPATVVKKAVTMELSNLLNVINHTNFEKLHEESQKRQGQKKADTVAG